MESDYYSPSVASKSYEGTKNNVPVTGVLKSNKRCFDWKRVPCYHVMDIFLHKNVTASCELRVFVTDNRKMIRVFIYGRILRTVYKTDDRFSVHISEPVCFIDGFCHTFEFFVNYRGKFKTETHLFSPDVQ